MIPESKQKFGEKNLDYKNNNKKIQQPLFTSINRVNVDKYQF